VGFVFVSHASEDKRRVRPLVHSLALLGVKLWIDRPGYGPSHFNFDQGFIERHGIRGIRAGADYDREISEALRQCDAVVACISRALKKDRQILVHELVVAKTQQKLVACIVDDLPLELPSDLGLADASKIQAERIDPEALQAAVDEISRGGDVSTLVGPIKVSWNVVLDLVRQIRRLSPWEPSDDDLREAAKELSQFPITPIIRASDIPLAITDIFAERFWIRKQREAFCLAQCAFARQCNPEGWNGRPNPRQGLAMSFRRSPCDRVIIGTTCFQLLV
jgi:hypothetical protein